MLRYTLYERIPDNRRTLTKAVAKVRKNIITIARKDTTCLPTFTLTLRRHPITRSLLVITSLDISLLNALRIVTLRSLVVRKERT